MLSPKALFQGEQMKTQVRFGKPKHVLHVFRDADETLDPHGGYDDEATLVDPERIDPAAGPHAETGKRRLRQVGTTKQNAQSLAHVAGLTKGATVVVRPDHGVRGLVSVRVAGVGVCHAPTSGSAEHRVELRRPQFPGADFRSISLLDDAHPVRMR